MAAVIVSFAEMSGAPRAVVSCLAVGGAAAGERRGHAGGVARRFMRPDVGLSLPAPGSARHRREVPEVPEVPEATKPASPRGPRSVCAAMCRSRDLRSGAPQHRPRTCRARSHLFARVAQASRTCARACLRRPCTRPMHPPHAPRRPVVPQAHFRRYGRRIRPRPASRLPAPGRCAGPIGCIGFQPAAGRSAVPGASSSSNTGSAQGGVAAAICSKMSFFFSGLVR